jgi:23S rRNA (adenine1618-N6)-methyltransferase
LHPKNKHQDTYHFEELIAACPELKNYVHVNKFSLESIDFFNPKAVFLLNKALLKVQYGIEHWELPQNYLCPPIPGRADYINHMADLLQNEMADKSQTKTIKCLDIGAGANCIYPILGVMEYGWNFVGSEIDPTALASAQKIVQMNPAIKGKIEIRLQPISNQIFSGIIRETEHFDLCICNPPFHSSAEEAQRGSQRKLNNLKKQKVKEVQLNFGGQSKELWCEGGEKQFIGNMIQESVSFQNNCKWFSTLVSKESSLPGLNNALKRVGAKKVKTISMNRGNKMSRVLAWTFAD